MRWLAFAVTVVTLGQGGWKSVVRNGSFEHGSVKWTLSGGAQIVTVTGAPHGNHTLRCDHNGAMATQLVIAHPAERYTASVWLRTDNVRPVSESGYAFAAVYEFDFHGNLLSFRDFAQQTGTNDWRRVATTWTTHPNAFYFELRLGLYNAQGQAWFDSVQVAMGEQLPEGFDEPPMRKGDLALILDDLALPKNPGAPSAQRLADLLKRAGYQPQIVTATQFADGRWVGERLSNIGLLVLPNAPYFPLDAHRNLLLLLTYGADLLTLGGYAFDVPLMRTDDGFKPVQLNQPSKVMLLNANPGFERVKPDGGAEGWEPTDPQCCFVTAQTACEGQHSAAVRIAPDEGQGSAGWRATVKAQAGDMLRLSGWVKTEGVVGSGYAYLAYYPYAGDKWVNPRDIAQVRGTQGWQYFAANFTVPYSVDRVVISFGLYNAVGTAFFDGVRLERVEMPPRINTHYGQPRDGLEVSPLQIGMFDAHYPLRSVVQLRTVAPFLPPWHYSPAANRPSPLFTGFSAVGVLRGSARWQPLLSAYDRFGRLRGTAAALMNHHAGVFAGSTWAFFGVDDVDLTTLPDFTEQVLLPLLHYLRRGVFLHGFQSHFACYRPNETVEAALQVSNFGASDFIGQGEFSLFPVPLNGDGGDERTVAPTQSVAVGVAAGERQKVTVRWDNLQLPEGLYRITAMLRDGDDIVDEMEAGFVVWDGQTFPRPLKFRYADNYFWLDDKPTFLLGTDTWSNWFHSPSQSDPLFWWRQIVKMRDFSVLVLENLQWTPPGYQFSQADWRKLEAAIYLCHRAGVVYMAGLLIGHDVAVDDATLQQQEMFVAEFARRYSNADGLIYYLNGDYQLRPKTPDQRDLHWQVEQTKRWNERLVNSIKAVDPNHPTTSEYYQIPIGGLDLRLTIDGLDVSNIGYFDEPVKDLLRFPAVFKLIDMRLYGKSLNFGEFGVKTHPAWERSLGAVHYHIRRTEQEQWWLFLSLPQYGFGLGGSKGQNWCWRDDDDRVFPWGLIYPCDDGEKDALKAYRAAGLLLMRLSPVWCKPEVVLVVPDSSRLLPDGAKAWQAALVAADTLVRLRVDFAVASDLALTDQLLDGVKAVFLPGALTVPPEAEAVLQRFGQKGGAVYRSGVGGETAWEWDVPEVGMTTDEQRGRYRAVLQRAGVAFIGVDPDLPTVHAFRVPLQNGEAFIFVNASDQEITFTAHSPDMPSIRMTLRAWQPGLVAVNESGQVFAAEGSGQIVVGDGLVAEGNGHFALLAQDEADVRETQNLILLLTEATTVTLTRTQPLLFKEALVGEWRNGGWATLERVSLVERQNAVKLTVAKDLRGELVVIGKALR